MNAVLDLASTKHLEIFQTLTEEEQATVTAALAKVVESDEQRDMADEDLVASITGKTYNRQQRLDLELETLARHLERRRQLLEGALTAPEIARLLGVSRQTPHDRLKNNSLLAVKHNGKPMFPRWQLDPAGPDCTVDGLPEVLKALPLSNYGKLNWLTRPNPYFEGLTPIEMLKQGQKEQVLQEASAIGVEEMQPALVPA